MKRTLIVCAALVLSVCLWPAYADQEGGEAPMSCGDCHTDVAASMAGQTHMRIRPMEVQGRRVGCEGCHGDGAQHMESGGDPEHILRFGPEGAGDDACLQCHATKRLSDWHASTHAAHDVSCATCHNTHTGSEPLTTCQECHGDVTGRFMLPSRHPVREGRMTCASCHDVHSAAEAQLKTHDRVNELCYQCHQEKEGPFIFEHQPVLEDCRECHEPHGAPTRALLKASEPMLCLQCHDMHFHAGYEAAEGEIEVGGTHRENPFGAASFNRAFTTKCSQCHVEVHGSDLPSQGITSRGKGLTR